MVHDPAPRLGKTATAVLAEVTRTGKMIHSCGVGRRARYAAPMPYGRRVRNAINALESAGLVVTERTTTRSTGGWVETVIVVRPASLDE